MVEAFVGVCDADLCSEKTAKLRWPVPQATPLGNLCGLDGLSIWTVRRPVAEIAEVFVASFWDAPWNEIYLLFFEVFGDLEV